MLTFYSDWQDEDTATVAREFRCGVYSKMDFYGPRCHFEAKRKGKHIRVVPYLVEFEGAENSIGDFNLIELMAIDLFDEFGPFDMNIPRLGRDIKINYKKEINDVLTRAIIDIKLI